MYLDAPPVPFACKCNPPERLAAQMDGNGTTQPSGATAETSGLAVWPPVPARRQEMKRSECDSQLTNRRIDLNYWSSISASQIRWQSVFVLFGSIKTNEPG